jgi:peptide/nickel transport system substrate-binding protein
VLFRSHDNQPVTVDDAYFTFKDIIQNPAFRNPILKNAFEGVKIEKLANENAIKFTLKKPNSYFVSYLTVGLVPKHLLSDASIASLELSSFGKQPIGSGPYKLTGIKLNSDGDQVDLALFDTYYGEKPVIKSFRFFTFPTEKEMLRQKGALHSISKLSEDGKTIISGDQRFTIYPYTLNQFTALYLNSDNTFLANKDVRQAINFGIHKNDLIFNGEQRVDALDIATHKDNPEFAFDLAHANQILDGLSFTKPAEQGGIRVNSKGEKFSITLLVAPKIPLALANKIKEQLLALGVEVNIDQPTDEWKFYDLVTNRRYDMLLSRQNLGNNKDFYPMFHSSQAGGTDGTPSGQNFANFRSFRTDGLTEAIRKEQDYPSRQKLLAQLSKIVSDEIPVIFISTPVYSYALDKNLQGFPVSKLNQHSERLLVLPYLK